MSLAQIEFFSPSMGKHVSYTIYLPDVGEGPFPVLFQLHGLSDSDRTWTLHSNIARHAQPYPMVIVFPDGGTNCYLNWQKSDSDDRNDLRNYLDRRNYEDMIITDIAGHVKRHFNVTDGPWAIGGLSMGGYGSMRLGLKYPQMFASIWSHSSKIEFDDLKLTGAFADPEDIDIRTHARARKAEGNAPVITFDCGVDDFLIEENRRYHAFLNEIDLEHTYNEHPGDHEWNYWDTHVQEALVQHARVLGIERIERS
ncbi:MAG: alpha/beta hydrolase-fold protein [Thermomicrobiales bacterium]|nr:alpha/beta hydrolase-fold protein [Thermomicrobiales bacterium]MCO5217520.1 alpha/beta hydrolase-fold protein [Thermomicrobiales bacterium]MCO5224001.1 alpha/beta hydrolase-fold protein [Thermomicrobiales bacterium]MCO5226815.1 alpha/beta hydrolase-fold protein [Thermomicrobiales bacterium]